jgi:Kef-type K+ transport system membrane component KefB/voltage-gated potassium channel Kch
VPEPVHAPILIQIAIAIVAATLGGLLAKVLRQPLILGYLIAGVVIGPLQGLGLIDAHDIEPVAELGLILLLFMIGLEIDLRKLAATGGATVAAGVGQFGLCVVMGLGFAPLLGFDGMDAAYLAVAAALSSTMIVVKLLYDKAELDTEPGRITLGILVFQDLWAIAFLALQPTLQDPDVVILLLSVLKGAGLVAFAFLTSGWVLPPVFRTAAKSPELMLIGALGWCFLMVLASAELGLSREMGALIAGVSLSTFPYNLNVIAKVISLRDFFLTLFFVTLGAQIPGPSADILLAALALSGFLVASRFLSITPLLHFLRQGNRVAFIPALNLSQISEFSLVICTLGIAHGHIGEDVRVVVVLTFAITSVLSTYALTYNYEIFRALNPILTRLGLRDLGHGESAAADTDHDIILLGLYRDGSSLIHELLARDPTLRARLAVIDFNPKVKDRLERLGVRAIYGDISHRDTLHHADIEHAKVLVSTVPDALLRGTTNARLLEELRGLAPHAAHIVTSDDFGMTRELYEAGAGYVYVPRLMGAGELAEVVRSALSGDLTRLRDAARDALEHRVEVLD